MDAEPQANAKLISSIRWLAAWGPGLLVMLADTDAGNVVTAAQSGALWGYRLLPLLFALIPLLYMVQELTVRLGIFTGRGHGELIRDRFGAGWGWLSAAGLAVATVGSLITEFTGVAGVGELFGLSRSVSLPLGDRGFLYLSAALIGAVFNPWMVFYQQSAVADKGLLPEDYRAARLDTAFGAGLTQLLTAAVLVAAAATLGARGGAAPLTSVGDFAAELTPVLGGEVGRLIFGVGVLGAAMVAAVVSSLALAWGVGEVAGYRRALERRPLVAAWFYGVYAAAVVGSAALVWLVPDLVWLNIAAQVLNAFLLPLVIGFLVALASKTLPEPHRLRGWYRWLVTAVSAVVCILGLCGGVAGLF